MIYIAKLRFIIIGYITLIILLESIKFFYFESHDSLIFYIGYFNQISVYLILLSILIFKNKTMWIIGFLYFFIGSIDLLFWNIGDNIPRHISSGYSRFQFSYLIGWSMYAFKDTFNNDMLMWIKPILDFKWFKFIELLIFPSATLLFLSNYIRAYYGLKPILKGEEISQSKKLL